MIPCAGFGTRMKQYTHNRPKPLLPVNQIPLISYSLFLLKEWQVTDCIINLHYLGHLIEDYLKDFPYFTIHFSHEKHQLLGTAGAIRTAMTTTPLQGRFLFLNPDTIFWPDHSPYNDLADFETSEISDSSTVVSSLLYLSPKPAGNTERGFSSTNRLSYTQFEPIQIGEGDYFYSGISLLHTDLVKDFQPNFVAELRDSFRKTNSLYGRLFQGQRIDCGTVAEYESLKTLDLVPNEWKHRWNRFLDGWPTAKIDTVL
ncbi:MAG: NTP transferase domain-containing protein [Leptonema sp. (in: Bacteria)]|nr:NTP transferase domain-containing protein [Leptonema sp. (in: bacteria)]